MELADRLAGALEGLQQIISGSHNPTVFDVEGGRASQYYVKQNGDLKHVGLMDHKRDIALNVALTRDGDIWSCTVNSNGIGKEQAYALLQEVVGDFELMYHFLKS